MSVPVIKFLEPWLTVIACAAALARDADGTSCMPLWLAALLQTPALLAYLHRQSGWFGLRKSSGWTRGDAATGLIVSAGAVAVAIGRGGVDPFFICTTIYLAGHLVLETCTAIARRIEAALDTPERITRVLLGPWLICILLGTVLLALPLSTQSGVPDYRHNFWLHVSNGAFSAAGAASLTGLGAYSFGEDFSVFGRVVLMLMTQLCGMAFAGVGLAIVRPMLMRSISLKTVWRTCLGLQVAAAFVMVGAWRETDATGITAKMGWSVVHAVSAMWNGGFVMKGSGLADYLGDSRVFSCITLLSIIGSLGVPIVIDLLSFRPRGSATGASVFPMGPWCKLPSWEAGVTFALLLGAAVMLFVCETPRFLPEGLVPSRPFDLGTNLVPMREERDNSSRWRTAVFVSATLRSAGMQSIPVSAGALSWPSYATMLACMFIGGSIGGTAGGVRSSLLVLVPLCLLHGAKSWSAHPEGVGVRWRILRRLACFSAAWLVINACAVAALAMCTDGTWYEQSFEALAALNNVGLSTGLSQHLTWGGRLTMIVLMLIGRWGPIVFWLRLSGIVSPRSSRPAI